MAAAINVAGLGLILVVLPYFLGSSPFAAAFRALAPLGWLLIVAGGSGIWFLRRKQSRSTPASEVGPGTPPRSPKRPTRPAPLVERLDATSGSEGEMLRDADRLGANTSSAKHIRPSEWSASVFGLIEWRRFEAVVEALFAQAGFLTKAQSHGPDQGVDVWLYSKNQPDGAPVSVVQCKHWQGKPVGVDKVRELRGVMAAKGVARGQFATTSTFTPDATSFAGENGIKLHDAPALLALIAKRTPEQQRLLLDVALEGEYWKPTCASCGIKMIEREPTAGGRPFWGCANFPNCRTTMKMRAS